MDKRRAKCVMQAIIAPTATLHTMLAQPDIGLYQEWSTVINAPLATSALIPTCPP